jgi:hypothetical protein
MITWLKMDTILMVGIDGIVTAVKKVFSWPIQHSAAKVAKFAKYASIKKGPTLL